MTYEIQITSGFCATHQLRLGSGRLESMHGHDWKVTLVVGAERLDPLETVMDFHILQSQLAKILERWHYGHLNDSDPFRSELNPTAERVAFEVARRMQLDPRAVLLSVTVEEAPGCRATYRPS